MPTSKRTAKPKRRRPRVDFDFLLRPEVVERIARLVDADIAAEEEAARAIEAARRRDVASKARR